ncbi:MAG: Transposase, IS30 family [candidate division TM6 bacterium GW2011_GWE2_41_16]|nr:MAG: Transposase, IS30 family [candidate division TM6 bacterium GW2011_GWE2_41_16]
MPREYRHLTYEQRCQIYELMQQGIKQTEIAERVGVSQSTICRELAKGSGRKGFDCERAHKKALQRKSKASSGSRIIKPKVAAAILRLLIDKRFSPKKISKQLKEDLGISVSHETVYSYIRKDQRNGGCLHTYLPIGICVKRRNDWKKIK